jgi:hypothetical protein
VQEYNARNQRHCNDQYKDLEYSFQTHWQDSLFVFPERQVYRIDSRSLSDLGNRSEHGAPGHPLLLRNSPCRRASTNGHDFEAHSEPTQRKIGNIWAALPSAHDCREKERPGTGREAGLGHAGVRATQDAVAE